MSVICDTSQSPMGPLSVEQSAVADCRRHKRKISLSSAVVFGENVATVVAEGVSVEVIDFETERLHWEES